MLTITTVRHQGTGLEVMSRRSASIGNALSSLIVYEFGYGGHTTELKETRVVVETEILGRMDKAIFEGSAEEILPLVIAAAHHSLILSNKRATAHLAEHALQSLAKIESSVSVIPRFVTNLTPLLMGAPIEKSSLFAAHNVRNDEELRRMIPCKLKDLAAASELALETNKPLLAACMSLGIVG